MSLEQSVVVIPAFNEEGRLPWVLEAAQNADNSLVHEKVIVVDNNSTDRTAEIAHAMGAKVVKCVLQGKGWALKTGIVEAEALGAETITLLDSDLIDLKGKHVNSLTEPVLERRSPMSIGYLGGRKAFYKTIQNCWGGFSGQRSVSVEILNLLNESDLLNARIEGALNAICRNLGVHSEIEKMELDGVRHVGYRLKRERAGDSKPVAYLRASEHYARIYGSAIRGLLTKSGK